jgi:serine acetyltransferase
MLFMVAEAMHENGGALHATDRMLDKDTDVTDSSLRRLLRFVSLRARLLWTLARLLVRHGTLITTVIRWHAQISSVDTPMEVGQPIVVGGQLVLHHAVLMVMTTQGSTEKA